MATVLPNHIEWNDTKRNGERLVYEWFSNDKIEGTVYYSMWQKNHIHKLIGEVDFLYVGHRGAICFEVKGGMGIYRKDRVWHSINKMGKDYEIHNPFKQANDCSYALKRYFHEVYDGKSELANTLIGYAVVFPECKFTGDGNDLTTEIMFDGRYNLEDFPSYIDKVFDYWERLEIERHGRTPMKLSPNQLEQINNLLRGDFRVVPSMQLEFQHVEQRMLQLTEEQYDILEVADENDRVIIQGAAGTGKTLLAMEMARKYTAKNLDVLYVCFNKHMAEYVKSSIESPECDVTTYHSLLMNRMNEQYLYENNVVDISNKYLKFQDSGKKYDAIVVDEGQDLFKAEVIDSLNKLIKSGMVLGKWVFFMDSNQNIFNDASDYDITLEYVKELFHPVMLTLRTNCRNTEQIALRTSTLTLTPSAKYLKLSGPNVVTRKYDTDSEFISMFKKELMSLISSGVTPNDVVIISKYKKEKSKLSRYNELCNLKIVEGEHINLHTKNTLRYYTVQSFKGLESKVVFYIDVDGFESIENRQINYVAMSRAKIQLILFFNKELLDEYEECLDKGRELLP